MEVDAFRWVDSSKKRVSGEWAWIAISTKWGSL